MTSPQNRWFDDNILQDPDAFFWCNFNEEAGLSANNSCCDKDAGAKEKNSAKKRTREVCSGATSKAKREKMRRDRLNNRFLELSSILEPGKTPKTDKICILADALQALNELKAESQQLKESNDKLRESIKVLKAEKIELRDEKTKLKTQKDQLEQQLKMIAIPPPASFLPHPIPLHAAMAAAYSGKEQLPAGKTVEIPGYPGMGMWQWLSPAALDTSQDHKLRAPVA